MRDFIVQQGQATFTIGDTTQEVSGGSIVVALANTPTSSRIWVKGHSK